MRHCMPLVHAVSEGAGERFAKFLYVDRSVNDALMVYFSFLFFKLRWTSLDRYDDSPHGYRNGCNAKEEIVKKATGCNDRRRKTNRK